MVALQLHQPPPLKDLITKLLCRKSFFWWVLPTVKIWPLNPTRCPPLPLYSESVFLSLTKFSVVRKKKLWRSVFVWASKFKKVFPKIWNFIKKIFCSKSNLEKVYQMMLNFFVCWNFRKIKKVSEESEIVVVVFGWLCQKIGLFLRWSYAIVPWSLLIGLIC